MVNEKKLYLSKLGDSLRFSYGNEYDVSASYIYDRIKESEDMGALESVGLIINEDEIDDRQAEVFRHVMKHVEFDENGKPKFNLSNSDSFTVNYKTLPVIVDVTKEDIAEGHKCLGCGTTYLAQNLCPVCGNGSINDDEPPICLVKILKRDAYQSQHFNEWMLEREIKEISKTYPNYDCKSDFVLWITIDLYERFINENVFGSINIFKKDGSLIPVDTVIRKPYPNKNYYQISKKVKLGRNWKRNFGIPLIFNSMEEINEIEKIIVKWELHTIVEGKLLIETMIVNHPFFVWEYSNDDRKKIISVKLRDYFVDSLLSLNSLRCNKDYEKEFARTCVIEDVFTVKELQDDVCDDFHNFINDAIYENIITSSEELMSIKPRLDIIKKTIKNKNLSDNFIWRVNFGMRYIRENLKYHR